MCPECNNVIRSIKLATKQQLGYEMRCINCNNIIDDINTTLLYYNGYILPDSNVILLSRDKTVYAYALSKGIFVIK